MTWLRPRADGTLDPSQVADALRPDTALVSLMHANNETGVLTDVDAIAGLCNARGIPLHADAAQSAGKVPLDVESSGIALLSFSAHKLGGPKGIGALYVRRRPRPGLQPLVFGGGHEGGLRSGTLALHQVVGFGAACALAGAGLVEEAARQRALRDALWQALQAAAPLWRNGTGPALPGILNVGFAGIEGESLLLELDGDLELSSGSACSSASAEPSYVLRALGRSDPAIQASMRLSLGRSTTGERNRSGRRTPGAGGPAPARRAAAGSTGAHCVTPSVARYSVRVLELFRALPGAGALRWHFRRLRDRRIHGARPQRLGAVRGARRSRAHRRVPIPGLGLSARACGGSARRRVACGRRRRKRLRAARPQRLARELDVPAEKMGRLLVVEDAGRALLAGAARVQ